MAPTDLTIYFDLDGVLADFDTAAGRVLATNNIYKFEFVYGQAEFWKRLDACGDFFATMPVLPGALSMVSAVCHNKLAILTALPKSNADRVNMHKRAWVRNRIGDLNVITCFTKDKPKYCKPGDVLVDDRAVNKSAWEKAGGRFIVHTDVNSTLAQLDSMGLTR